VPRDTALRSFGARLTGRPEHDVSMILPQVHLRNGEGICVVAFLLFALPVSREARLHLKPWPPRARTHRRLVCELHPRVLGGGPQKTRGLGCGWPIEQPALRSPRAVAASLTLLPYPRPLAWPRTPFGLALGSQSFRAFPQFGDVADPAGSCPAWTH